MSFVSMWTKLVGDPLVKEYFDRIKANFDDHESRINSLATSGGTVFIFNGDVDFEDFSSLEPDIFYYKARQDFSVNDFRAQLFGKDGVVSGNLVIDLQKSVDTNDANFATILTSSLSFNFASDAAYSEKVGSIDSALNDILTDEVLRVKVTGLPTGYYGKILLSIGAQ